MSEDCLYLNIWTPAKAKTAHEQLPVIVWIYGGGYINGSASMPLYCGDRLAQKTVIVVTVAYRLGPLGFLALPKLTRESPHHLSGNYGLLDQIDALQWIHWNIVAFGGDPKCVTIAGQSSGSISVSILMASPLAKGLFQRAIGESGDLFDRSSSHQSSYSPTQNATAKSTPFRWVRPRSRIYAGCPRPCLPATQAVSSTR